ncbi:hypothetical protein J0L31_01165 [Terrisporobacter glycolicus]|nr:hypothetical protein [Terrisporobacter glycolicus]
MKLKFPSSFSVKYPKENLLYYSGRGKENILKILMNSCNSYCMYCGKSIITDSKEEFNIEHSLEKSMKINDNNFLENCKYNLSIACPSCNQKYKTRMIDILPQNLFENKIDCLTKECTEPCDIFKTIFKEYIKLNNIILQPNVIESYLKDYIIEYDLFNHIFEPGEECSDLEARSFISNHIARFHLNREMYTESVLRVCEKIYNNIKIFGSEISIEQIFKSVQKERYENVLEEIFMGFLKDNFKNTSILYDYCELTLILSYT